VWPVDTFVEAGSADAGVIARMYAFLKPTPGDRPRWADVPLA